MYVEQAVPAHLQPFIRRVLVADETEEVDVTSAAQPTGYIFLGFHFRGEAEAQVGYKAELASQDSTMHLSGQIVSTDITVRFRGPIGHLLVEFSGLGHFELLGVHGADTVDRCQLLAVFNSEAAKMFSSEAGFERGKN